MLRADVVVADLRLAIFSIGELRARGPFAAELPLARRAQALACATTRLLGLFAADVPLRKDALTRDRAHAAFAKRHRAVRRPVDLVHHAEAQGVERQEGRPRELFAFFEANDARLPTIDADAIANERHVRGAACARGRNEEVGGACCDHERTDPHGNRRVGFGHLDDERR
jgi:hypothetical protein